MTGSTRLMLPPNLRIRTQPKARFPGICPLFAAGEEGTFCFAAGPSTSIGEREAPSEQPSPEFSTALRPSPAFTVITKKGEATPRPLSENPACYRTK